MPTIHRAGWPFIAAAFALSLILGLFSTFLFWLGLLLTVWCGYFFRDPVRVIPERDGLVVSPADGVVCSLRPRVPPAELNLGATALPCVSIFMNVFDVHVNRAPVAGRLLHSAHHHGAFLNASFDKASEANERRSYLLETADGQRVGLVQVAGLVARRIVSFVLDGSEMKTGQRVGLIRFGSRCDVYLPHNTAPLVCDGQRMIAGETVLADLHGGSPPPRGRPD